MYTVCCIGSIYLIQTTQTVLIEEGFNEPLHLWIEPDIGNVYKVLGSYKHFNTNSCLSMLIR